VASVVYPKYKEALLSGSSNISLSSGTVKVILIDTADYTYSSAHDMLDDVPSAARVATSGALANKTVTNGTFDSDDPSFTGVTGDQSEALIYYIDTGTESTSRLVAYVDSASSGLPMTPNGGNINVTQNASGIFSL
jgi:hypothetical protein